MIAQGDVVDVWCGISRSRRSGIRGIHSDGHRSSWLSTDWMSLVERSFADTAVCICRSLPDSKDDKSDEGRLLTLDRLFCCTSHECTVKLYKPRSMGVIRRGIEFLAAKPPEFVSLNFLAAKEGRDIVQTTSAGEVRLDLHVLLKDSPHDPSSMN